MSTLNRIQVLFLAHNNEWDTWRHEFSSLLVPSSDHLILAIVGVVASGIIGRDNLRWASNWNHWPSASAFSWSLFHPVNLPLRTLGRPIRSLVHSFSHSLHSLIHSFVHSFIRSSAHSFAQPFTLSLIHVTSTGSWRARSLAGVSALGWAKQPFEHRLTTPTPFANLESSGNLNQQREQVKGFRMNLDQEPLDYTKTDTINITHSTLEIGLKLDMMC